QPQRAVELDDLQVHERSGDDRDHRADDRQPGEPRPRLLVLFVGPSPRGEPVAGRAHAEPGEPRRPGAGDLLRLAGVADHPVAERQPQHDHDRCRQCAHRAWRAACGPDSRRSVRGGRPDGLSESRRLHLANRRHLQRSAAVHDREPGQLPERLRADADFQARRRAVGPVPVGGVQRDQPRQLWHGPAGDHHDAVGDGTQQRELRPDSDGRRSAYHAVRVEVHVLVCVPTTTFERRGRRDRREFSYNTFLCVLRGLCVPLSQMQIRRLFLTVAACGLAAAIAAASDWPTHDGDAAGRRFSPLKQITPANVARLQPAWTFDTGATGIQVTPLVVGGIMYLTAGKDIVALEPETAKIIWKYTAPAAVGKRGVAYWPGDRDTPPRLFSGAGDRLLAVDAERGRPAAGFGEEGSVDLKASVRGDVDGGFSLASPPAVFKNVVITGGNNGEQAPSAGLYGDIRGWDARSGKLLWSFHTVPRAGEPGVETWEGESWKNRSGTNVWSFFTIDVERGLVFAPLGSPTSDYYGGDRKGANLYGNSIVALDALTGKVKWYRQLVHHDLWDYDLPAAPTLFDVKRSGRTIPAVGVVTKMG